LIVRTSSLDHFQSTSMQGVFVRREVLSSTCRASHHAVPAVSNLDEWWNEGASIS